MNHKFQDYALRERERERGREREGGKEREFGSISLKATIETVAGVFVESGVNAAITLPPANYQTSRRMLYRDNNRLSIPYITESLFVLFNSRIVCGVVAADYSKRVCLENCYFHRSN